MSFNNKGLGTMKRSKFERKTALSKLKKTRTLHKEHGNSAI